MDPGEEDDDGERRWRRSFSHPSMRGIVRFQQKSGTLGETLPHHPQADMTDDMTDKNDRRQC